MMLCLTPDLYQNLVFNLSVSGLSESEFTEFLNFQNYLSG